MGSGVSTEGFVTTAAGGGVEEGTGVGAGGCGAGEAAAAGGRSPSWPDIALWVWQFRQSHSLCKTKKIRWCSLKMLNEITLNRGTVWVMLDLNNYIFSLNTRLEGIPVCILFCLSRSRKHHFCENGRQDTTLISMSYVFYFETNLFHFFNS